MSADALDWRSALEHERFVTRRCQEHLSRFGADRVIHYTCPRVPSVWRGSVLRAYGDRNLSRYLMEPRLLTTEHLVMQDAQYPEATPV